MSSSFLFVGKLSTHPFTTFMITADDIVDCKDKLCANLNLSKPNNSIKYDFLNKTTTNEPNIEIHEQIKVNLVKNETYSIDCMYVCIGTCVINGEKAHFATISNTWKQCISTTQSLYPEDEIENFQLDCKLQINPFRYKMIKHKQVKIKRMYKARVIEFYIDKKQDKRQDKYLDLLTSSSENPEHLIYIEY